MIWLCVMAEDHSSTRGTALGLVLVFLASSMVGCLSETQSVEGIDLIVHYENTNGTIVDSYIDGDHVSTTDVFLDFDFSKTISDTELVEFGIVFFGERPPISIDPNTDSIISVEFPHHGIHEIVAYAINEQNVQENHSIIIRIEQKIEWLESNTYNPKTLTIDTFPNNEGISPSAIIINSTVENPELIENVGGGREVEITWSLVDEQEDACQGRYAVVHEGEQVNWKTIHFNTFELHELRISYDDGQDLINVNQSILIEYSQLESPPTG